MTTTSWLTVIIGAPASFFALQATGGVPPYTWSATPPDSLLDFPIPVTPSGIVTRDISVDQFGVAHPGLTPSTSEFRLPGGDDLYAMRADMPAVIRARFTVTDSQGATGQGGIAMDSRLERRHFQSR